jgi:hypothetical protein
MRRKLIVFSLLAIILPANNLVFFADTAASYSPSQ